MTVTDGNIEIYLSSTSAYDVTFSWTVLMTGTVTGATNGSGNVIDQQVQGNGKVTYYVIATETATGCSGNITPIEVTVVTEEQFGNIEQSGAARKNDCPPGQIGSYETYVVLANTYFAPTQNEANNLALQDVFNNKQEHANNVGTCSEVPEGDYTIGLYEEQPSGSGTIIQVYAELRDENNSPIQATEYIVSDGSWNIKEISTGNEEAVTSPINLTAGNSRVNMFTYDVTVNEVYGYAVSNVTPNTMDGHNIIGI